LFSKKKLLVYAVCMIIILQAVGKPINQAWTKTQMQQWYKRETYKMKGDGQREWELTDFHDETGNGPGHQYLHGNGPGHQYLQSIPADDMKLEGLPCPPTNGELVFDKLSTSSAPAGSSESNSQDFSIALPASTAKIESDRGKRGIFPRGSWKVLLDIITKGEGGRFLEIVEDKSANANMARADVWKCITKLFNAVCTLRSY
jgi:hypothetical protein